jgi:hypothetical protein
MVTGFIICLLVGVEDNLVDHGIREKELEDVSSRTSPCCLS